MRWDYLLTVISPEQPDPRVPIECERMAQSADHIDLQDHEQLV